MGQGSEKARPDSRVQKHDTFFFARYLPPNDLECSGKRSAFMLHMKPLITGTEALPERFIKYIICSRLALFH